jgi:hypothetical protein
MIVRLHGISKRYIPSGDTVSFECDFVDIATEIDTFNESVIVSQDETQLNINIEYINKKDDYLK